jgi:NADH-quinone oxidoreductase subunit M
VADVGWLVASAVLLPLFPLHGVYTSLTARLPAGAAVMLLVGLPALGFDAAFAVVPRLPPPVQSLVTACALLGAAYGSIKALVQARVTGLISYGGLALLSILWWYAAGGQPGAQTAFLYLAAATLVTAGVRLAWWSMETRYGGIILGQVGGLSRTMPRFAFLLALLVMAATGLPPFGLFSAYMQMLLAMASAGPAMAAAVLSAWLLGSWYWLSLLQRMLFGEPRWDVPYEDVRGAEMAALVVVIVSLLVIGLAPLFGPNGPGSSPSVASHQADRDVEGRL